ncbi:MAG: outer membrane protein assembly factor BamA [Alphaproteobacteria bacterium]|nr:outer membrane protein assembly factor BamA [Alphaproteobacteria bacterium]
MRKVLFLCVMAAALAARADVLKSVAIDGTKRIENATIRAYVDIADGQQVTDADLDAATKALFATGLFSDVSAKMDKGVLKIAVKENPIVYQVYFEGNKALDEEALKSETQLKPRMVYTERKIQSDVGRLLEVYKRNGRFAARVVPKIIRKDQNRVDIVYEIDEGDKAYVRVLNIVGAKAFSTDTLKDKMLTREKAWYRFLSSTDTYDPDRLNYDQELLRRFYLQEGYADFKVESALAELLPDKTGFMITIKLDEGPRYRMGAPDIEVSLPDFKDEASLAQLVDFRAGDRFDIVAVERSVDAMVRQLADAGYAFVNVAPDMKKDADAKIVSVVFRVSEGRKVMIRKINIAGNSRTLDKVIRREFRIKEGDAFNASLLRRSKQRVEDLDFFSKVDLQTNPAAGNASQMDVLMDVREKSTGAFNIGVGWSSYNGLMTDIGVVERNILGTGNMASVNMMISEQEDQFSIGLTDPYFMDKDLSAGVDAFHTTRDNTDYSSYKYQTSGAAVRFGWNYTDRLGQSARYTLRQDEIHSIQSGASKYIWEQAGKTWVSMVGQQLAYDRRDSKINTTEGYYLSFGTDVAGLGGDVRFLRYSATGIKYYPVADDVVFSLRADASHIVGLGGKDIRMTDRYFLGDFSLRGFEYGGTGARDKASDDALGGNWFASGSAELSFPLGLPKELGINGKVFGDVGVVGKPDNFDSAEMYYSNKPRVAVGTGILWKSPMGVINLDFSWPVVKDTHDKTKVFRLNFGKGF